MKQAHSLYGLIVLVFFISCVKSLYPLTDKTQDMLFKKELLGNWKAANDSTEYIIDTVKGSQEKKYAVMLIDRSTDNKTADTSNFLAMLVNLKGHYFMDCLTDTSQQVYTRIGEWSRSFLLPSHFFIRIYSINKNSIVVASIDKDVLSGLLKNKKINIKHEDIGDDILLSEKSAMLQKKLVELEKFPSIYKKDTLTKR